MCEISMKDKSIHHHVSASENRETADQHNCPNLNTASNCRSLNIPSRVWTEKFLEQLGGENSQVDSGPVALVCEIASIFGFPLNL